MYIYTVTRSYDHSALHHSTRPAFLLSLVHAYCQLFPPPPAIPLEFPHGYTLDISFLHARYVRAAFVYHSKVLSFRGPVSFSLLPLSRLGRTSADRNTLADESATFARRIDRSVRRSLGEPPSRRNGRPFGTRGSEDARRRFDSSSRSAKTLFRLPASEHGFSPASPRQRRRNAPPTKRGSKNVGAAGASIRRKLGEPATGGVLARRTRRTRVFGESAGERALRRGYTDRVLPSYT